MAHGKGLDLILKLDVSGTKTAFAGARTNGLTINNEAIDVTDKDSAEWREILSGAGIKTVSTTVSGVFDTGVVASEARTAILAGTLKPVDVVVADGTWSGSFKITTMELTGEYNGAQQFSATLESSGPVTFA